MGRRLKVVAAVVLCLALPAWVNAQVVTPAAPATPGWKAPTMVAGDWISTQAIQKAKVTDDQKATLKPVLDELAKEASDGQAKMMTDYQNLSKANKAATDAGANPADDAAVKAARDEVTKQNAENAKGVAARRQKLLAALDGVLSAEQISTVKEEFARYNPDPAVRNKVLAHDWIKSSIPGVTLTADQIKQIETKAASIQEKFGQRFAEIQKAQGELMQSLIKDDPNKDFGAAYQTAQKEFAPKWDAARTELAKALNEVVESVLTEEQKKQAADGRKAAWNKAVVDWADATLKSFGPAKMTDDQMEKAMKLAAAAAEAMLKTDTYDSAARDKLAKQLREDIKRLLTDEQKAKVQ